MKYHFIYPGFRILFAITLLMAMAFFSAGILVNAMPHHEDIEQWTPDTALPTGLEGTETLVHQGHILVFGGRSDNGIVNTVRVAAIQADGMLGDWKPTTAMPAPLFLQAVVATQKYVYMIGGYDGKNVRNDVWRAPFSGDGKIGDWQWIGHYSMPILMHDAVIVRNYLYVSQALNSARLKSKQPFTDLKYNPMAIWEAGKRFRTYRKAGIDTVW